MPQDLAGHLTLSMSEDESRQRWELHGPDDVTTRVDIQPRLMAHDFPLLMESAKRGLGIALLPETVCGEPIHRGQLEPVLPDWSLPQGICHAVFPSRRGLLPSVRVFIDFLAEHLPPLLEASRSGCNKARAEHATQAVATV
jgi:DNA-binding transcriptional LysR family regulator